MVAFNEMNKNIWSVYTGRYRMYNHRITGWFGLEGTLQITQFHPPALGRDPFHQPRLLQAPSNLALNPARERAATASLGSLGQGLTILRVNNFILI